MSGSRLRVLVVDDDSELRELFVEALLEHGYHVEAVGSAEEALDRLTADAFNIVISDMVMPGMGGLELVKRISGSGEGILAIMISGDAAIETASKAIEAGAFGYLAKPFRLDEAMILIKNASDRLYLTAENARLREDLKLAHAEIAALKRLSVSDAARPGTSRPAVESPRKGKKACPNH